MALRLGQRLPLRLALVAQRSIATGNRGLLLKTRLHAPLASFRRNDELPLIAVRYAAADRSKVEQTLKMLKEDIRWKEEENKRLKLVPVKEEGKKLTIKEKVIHELKHYYHGFRLLALETKVSGKYLWRIIRGNTLTRRERQQLVRTMSDLFRLVPFSFFIIVPFMEFALPIFLKLFPNMLPSTFQEAAKQEEKLRRQVKVKVEMAKFLQDTLEDMALEKKKKSTNKDQESKALDFARFIKKVRTEGGYVSNEELFKFSKLFEDELTLDNLAMSQLRALCRLLSIPPLGSPEILRFQLNMKLRELKADDKQIAAEGGVSSLTTLDLQQASRARGMRAVGVSEQRLKEQLDQWLELSLNDKVPPSLLLLSRTLYMPEDIPFTDRLKMLVKDIPEGVAEHTRQRITQMEGGQVDHKARMDLIKKIEEAIKLEKTLATKEEEAQKAMLAKEKAEAAAAAAAAAAPSAEELAAARATADAAEAAVVSAAEAVKTAVNVINASTALPGKEDMKAAAVAEVKKVVAAATDVAKEAKKEEAIDLKHLSRVEDILLGGPLHEAKHDIKGLKEQVSEHSEDLVKVNLLDEAFAESKVAKRLRSKVDSMIKSVDHLVVKLEESKRNLEETIADPAHPEEADLKKRKEVRVADVIESLKKLRKVDASDEEAASLENLVKVLDDDLDGFIDSEHVLEVIELLEKHSDVKIAPSQLAAMIEVLKKEDRAEQLEEAKNGEGDKKKMADGKEKSERLDDDLSLPEPDIPPSVTAPLRQQQETHQSKEKPTKGAGPTNA